jgi:glycosyltransferase involved in cell wall biosynthesis
MRVCLVTSSFPRFPGDWAGGFIYDLARHLSENGLQVIVLAPHAPGLPTHEDLDTLRVYRFRYFIPSRYQRLAYGSGISTNVRRSLLARLQLLPFVWAQWTALHRIIEYEEIDLINSHWLIAQGLTGAFAHRKYNIPHVCTVHAAGIHALSHLPFKQKVSDFIAAHTDHFFVVSSFIGEHLQALLSTPARSTTLPMGVDTSLFTVRSREQTRRKQMELGDGPVLLFVGRLVEKKGVRYLIEALPKVLEEIPDVCVLIVGEGDLLAELQAIVRAHTLDKHVHFVGRVAHHQIPDYLALCDWLVVPSVVDASGQTEGMPVVLPEALASGRPVIASRVDGIPDLIIDGENGFMVQPGNAKDLGRQIIRALRRTDWQRFSAAARRTAEQYDWSYIATRYAETFYTIAQTSAEKLGSQQ